MDAIANNYVIFQSIGLLTYPLSAIYIDCLIVQVRMIGAKDEIMILFDLNADDKILMQYSIEL